LLIPGAQVVSLPVPEDAAPTFHGRDVFAPAAAALAGGASLASLGTPHPSPQVRRTPEVVREPDGTLRGEVMTIDRFGNVITNIVGHHTGTVRIGSQEIPVRRSYSEVDRGETVAVVGSSGLLEIAVRDGNAAEMHRISRGTPVYARHDRDHDGRRQ
jgi:S-adenosylmethionine hydrolase